MSPFQHGEVFVTDDGAETDLDLGHYERFTNAKMTRQEQLHHRPHLPLGHPEGAARRVPRQDRAGDSAHHRRDQERNIRAAAEGRRRRIVEVGGTVGDIESLPFLEAIRQMRYDVGEDNAVYVHLTLVPYIAAAGELKTKPTQHSVMKLREIGIQPDILLCRTDREISREMKDKIALFCNVDLGRLHGARRVLHLRAAAGAPRRGARRAARREAQHLDPRPASRAWERIVERFMRPSKGEVEIAIVGKYVDLKEAYKSLNEALMHGGIANDVKVELRLHRLARGRARRRRRRCCPTVDAVLVPGGFGVRGTEGQDRGGPLRAREQDPVLRDLPRAADGGDRVRAQRARPRGRQLARVRREDARPGGLPDGVAAGVKDKGGTMRLGAYPCTLKAGSLAHRLYKKDHDQRAPPPPLRVQQRLPRGGCRKRGSSSRASTPSSTWSR